MAFLILSCFLSFALQLGRARLDVGLFTSTNQASTLQTPPSSPSTPSIHFTSASLAISLNYRLALILTTAADVAAVLHTLLSATPPPAPTSYARPPRPPALRRRVEVNTARERVLHRGS